jgi:hypothetical protein
MSAYLQYVTAFHQEGRSMDIHPSKKHINNGKSKAYGVKDKDVALQQITIV